MNIFIYLFVLLLSSLSYGNEIKELEMIDISIEPIAPAQEYQSQEYKSLVLEVGELFEEYELSEAEKRILFPRNKSLSEILEGSRIPEEDERVEILKEVKEEQKQEGRETEEVVERLNGKKIKKQKKPTVADVLIIYTPYGKEIKQIRDALKLFKIEVGEKEGKTKEFYLLCYLHMKVDLKIGSEREKDEAQFHYSCKMKVFKIFGT